jgi:predicted nucleic acid-binding protein
MTHQRIVLDAAVAIALVHDEPDSDAIRATVAAWLADDVEFVVPDLFWLEVINPLARRHHYEGKRLLEVMAELDALSITTIEIVRPHHVLVMSLIDRFGLTAYDAAYIALAQTIDARVATTDREMLGAAGVLGLDPTTKPGHRLAEELPAYGPAEGPVTWPSWPGAGSYLATLRRQALSDG